MRPPWNESGRRDEWLAEVVRRGERIRGRRRLALSAAVAAALVAPAIGIASLPTGGEADRQFRVAAGGPPPASAAAARELPSVLGGTEAVAPTGPGDGAAVPVEPQGATTAPEAHGRVAAVDGSDPPPPTPTTRVVDDPVVRAAPGSGTASGSTGGNASSAAGDGGVSTPSTLGPPTSDPSLAACPAAAVQVTVSTAKSSYGPGETVRFSSTLENRSASACLVSGRAFFSVEDGAGALVGSFAYTADYMMPVKAEPGQVFTNSGSWDQRDCSGPACVPARAGTYVVVAAWTEGGAYTGRGSFEIGS